MPAPGSDGRGGTFTGELDVPQPAATSTSDLDPYHVPLAYSNDPSLAEAAAVTLEPFFPVSAPCTGCGRRCSSATTRPPATTRRT